MIDVDIWYVNILRINVMITSDLQMASIFPNCVVHMAVVGAYQVDQIFPIQTFQMTKSMTYWKK